jgi:hypothetical protein
MQGPRGNVGVVNGGLIDFHDNAQRGLPIEFQQQQQQQHHVEYSAIPSGIPGLAGNGAGCFTGPPSFLHVNGVTYRPVETPLPQAAERGPVVEVAATEPEPSSLQAASTKLLTEAELNRIVDDRVRQRVSSQVKGYLTRKPSGAGGRADETDDLGPRAHHSRPEKEVERRVERPARYYEDEEGDRPRSTPAPSAERPRYRADERSRVGDRDDREPRRAAHSTYSRDSDMEAAAAKVRAASQSMGAERMLGDSARAPRAGVVW